jgi:hypothetical protein
LSDFDRRTVEEGRRWRWTEKSAGPLLIAGELYLAQRGLAASTWERRKPAVGYLEAAANPEGKGKGKGKGIMMDDGKREGSTLVLYSPRQEWLRVPLSRTIMTAIPMPQCNQQSKSKDQMSNPHRPDSQANGWTAREK